MMVTILENLGAVIVAKTAIPQSIMYGETESPLWGLTTYPGRPELSPGGSSGGEGALMAMSGSLGGWGTDIGGSIRVQTHQQSNPPTLENSLTLRRCRATYVACSD
jgi:Asp-tRNA(Asn)/Glu-tRNA(Gln) amidotransferase A subunit family amidase